MKKPLRGSVGAGILDTMKTTYRPRPRPTVVAVSFPASASADLARLQRLKTLTGLSTSAAVRLAIRHLDLRSIEEAAT